MRCELQVLKMVTCENKITTHKGNHSKFVITQTMHCKNHAEASESMFATLATTIRGADQQVPL
jgi:hypothetical protein